MRPQDFELRVLRAIERAVKHGLPPEDSRFEFKSDISDPSSKLASQIAGLCNAHTGDWVAVVFGCTPQGQLLSPRVDLAQWWQQLTKHFDGTAPRLLIDQRLSYEEHSLLALQLDTSQAPYVVKCDDSERHRDTGRTLHVPWREGTRTRSATRKELLEILVPRANLPSAQILTASAFWSDGLPRFGWRSDLQLYFIHNTNDRVVIPYHKCQFWLKHNNKTIRALEVYEGQLAEPRLGSLVKATSFEVIIQGPGAAPLHLADPTPETSGPWEHEPQPIEICGELKDTSGNSIASFSATLYRTSEREWKFDHRWNFTTMENVPPPFRSKIED